MIKFIRHRWDGLGVVGKLSAASGAMLALVVFVGLVAAVALNFLRARTDDVVQHAVRVQRLVLQVQSDLLRARRSEEDFFHSWPNVGFDEAHRRHAQPCRKSLSSVIQNSQELQKALTLAKESGLSTLGADSHVEVIIRAANDYVQTFERGVSIVSMLGQDATGLRARMDELGNQAGARLAQLGREDLLALFRKFRLLVLKFALIHRFEDMESAKQVLGKLHRAVSMQFSLPEKDRTGLVAALIQLESGLADADAAEVRLARCMAVFDRQMELVEPVVDRLVKATSNEAQAARMRIDEAMAMALGAVIVTLLLCTVLTLFIYRLLFRSMAGNVLRLSQTAKELSRGNMDARANIDAPDEFGKLGATLDGMAARMTRLVDDLEKEAAVAGDRLIEAIESVPDGFALYDRHDRLALCNRNYMDIERNTPEMFDIGDRFKDIIRCNLNRGIYKDAEGEEQAWLEHRMQQHANPGKPFEQRLTDGRCLRICEYRTSLGEIVCVVGDITKRKQAEEELFSFNADLEQAVRERTQVLVSKTRELQRANRRLRELDEMKSNFLSPVSHELRTPLTSLLGFSRLIDRDFSRVFVPRADDATSQKIGQRIRSNLEIIHSEGERLTRLINDVLDLSRIETGKVTWRDQDVDLAKLLRQAADSVSGQFVQKEDVKLVLGHMEGLPLVHVDKDRMLQVFINLLNNAAKFTERGSVTIEASMDARGYAHVQVRDTGIGVAPDCIETIFDKFQQANEGDTLRMPSGGSGLGLAISRHIVDRYRGHIWATSEPGVGTTMHVALPSACVVPSPGDNSAQGIPSILVVDDDPAMRQLLHSILDHAGYHVETAACAEDGLELARKLHPDLISLDLIMPGMGGLETVENLRMDRDLANTPVLIVTVDTTADDAVCVMGANALVRKPVDREEYLNAVKRLLAGEGEVGSSSVVNSGHEENADSRICDESDPRISF